MNEKLIPAHILFAKWFVRIRWIALVILVSAAYSVKHLLSISIQESQIYVLAAILLALNIVHNLILKHITRKGTTDVIRKIKKEIHLQIITDLVILTLIIHYSGGIENPLVLFYFFHMIIASSIFSTLTSYLYAAFTLFLVSLLASLECFLVVPHYPLVGFLEQNLYKDVLFVFGTGIVFAFTSVLVVSLSHMIIYRSIKSEEAFVKTNMELENKDKLKNEYVLRVTHDIKGHVAAILSCIDVIRSGIAGPMNEVQKEFSDRAYERTELLSHFIKNLLNLTRKRLNRDKEFEQFQLLDVLNKVVVPVQTLANDKSIDFNFSFDKSVGIITGNPFTLEELYLNLLLNAIKYTPPNGNVSLAVTDHQDHYLSEISDTGIGIPEDEIPSIFDEFYRASNVPKDIKTGSGLGLSIAKQIVESHRGRISITSKVGAWTKITILLPRNPESDFGS
jgi:signal transduction histidine kinase